MRAYYENKVAVVTGAASGIGLAVTELLLDTGAIVFMADIQADPLNEHAERLNARHPGKAKAVLTDVTRVDQVNSLVEQAAAHEGHLDFLFNNAGVGATLPYEQVTLDCWKRVIDLNLWSVIYGMHAAVPIMRRQGGGHIVNTSSAAGVLAFPFQTVYSATKFAVTGMTQCLRYELWDEQVRFTTVCPGNVATAIFQAVGKIPEDAVPVDEAARIILEGVARNENLIVFPEGCRQLRQIPDEQLEAFMIQLSRERHESYRTKGAYF
jgi:NAD(P)-dependent dehydrogenase (short-subunit alcohol dehydrogenase family)